MNKTIALVLMITSAIGIAGAAYNMQKDSTSDQEYFDDYLKIEKAMQTVLDVCHKDIGKTSEECKKGMLKIIQGCNELRIKPPSCEDPRLFKYWDSG